MNIDGNLHTPKHTSALRIAYRSFIHWTCEKKNEKKSILVKRSTAVVVDGFGHCGRIASGMGKWNEKKNQKRQRKIMITFNCEVSLFFALKLIICMQSSLNPFQDIQNSYMNCFHSVRPLRLPTIMQSVVRNFDRFKILKSKNSWKSSAMQASSRLTNNAIVFNGNLSIEIKRNDKGIYTNKYTSKFFCPH